MVRHVALTHHTAYRYDGPVRLGPHLIRLRPAPHCRSAIPAYALEVTPAAHRLHWHQDPHGNHLARVLFQEPTETLTVTVDLIVDMTVVNPFDFLVEPAAATFPFTYEPWLRRDLQAFLEHGPAGPRLSAWLATVDRDPTDTVSLLVALNLRLHQDLAYTVRFEPGVQDPEETLALGRGSCRDSAWLLAQVCRHLGLAARFVSGYLIQLVPDEPPREGPPGVAADTADLHAWAEVYLPGAGWVGFDPTSGLLVGEGHIPLAATPDPVSAAPVTGTNTPAKVEFSFGFEVRRMAETPRPARPYADATWAAVEACGHRVDAALRDAGVVLTTGTRLAFVPARAGVPVGPEPEAAQWPALVEDISGAYAAARSAGLEAGAFLSDGRTVPAGLSPVRLGGAQPEAGPFVRRPALIGTLAAILHNHPSLSYLFAGRAVGAKGPAPRPDERDPEAADELALARAQLEGCEGAGADPAFADAVLRPLLTGADGRGEIGLAAYHPPHAPAERRGVVSLDGFAMLPHARLCLARLLLVRALVARLWLRPYDRAPVRWGRTLHDRFLLPYFAWADLLAVLAEIAEAGPALDPAWFRPHFEMRFPLAGAVDRMGLRLELRHALEAWPALAGTGAAPAPDDSVERLELRVLGPVHGRYAVLCNGRRLPLQAIADEAHVAGIRFRARRPPSSRHPGLPVTRRLVFDLIDLWSGRSAGGCTWYVDSPAGDTDEVPPVNAYEAESRRRARFSTLGHTPGPVGAIPEAPHADGAVTVDLRRGSAAPGGDGASGSLL